MVLNKCHHTTFGILCGIDRDRIDQWIWHCWRPLLLMSAKCEPMWFSGSILPRWNEKKRTMRNVKKLKTLRVGMSIAEPKHLIVSEFLCVCVCARVCSIVNWVSRRRWPNTNDVKCTCRDLKCKTTSERDERINTIHVFIRVNAAECIIYVYWLWYSTSSFFSAHGPVTLLHTYTYTNFSIYRMTRARPRSTSLCCLNR